MIEIKIIRQNKDVIIRGLNKRNFKNIEIVEEIYELDCEYRKTKTEVEQIINKLNINNNEIAKYLKTDLEKVESLKIHNKILKEEINQFNNKLEFLDNEIYTKLITLPNIPHDSVPIGTEASDNLLIREDLTYSKNNYSGAPHWEISKETINFELGSKLAGNGFPVFVGSDAKLRRALIQYFLDYNIDAGYTEYSVPYLVNYDTAYGTGQLPDKEGQMYYCEKDELYLIPTAEVPLTNIYRDKIIDKLPIKMTGYTPCFRRESGSYGKDVRGLNRVHQFDKVEIVQIVEPENSYQVLEEMVLHVEGLLKSLELPYRIIKLCGGDMGFTSALTYDFEVWSLVQQKWLEVSSVSNFETFQTNRMKIRYKKDKKNVLAHTLNGSSLALPRIMACIIENNQIEGGDIMLPNVLKKYF